MRCACKVVVFLLIRYIVVFTVLKYYLILYFLNIILKRASLLALAKSIYFIQLFPMTFLEIAVNTDVYKTISIRRAFNTEGALCIFNSMDRDFILPLLQFTV